MYQDPLLGSYVNEVELRHLLRKTIEFFEVVSQDSSSLAVDLRVLQGLEAGLPTKNDLRQRASMLSLHIDSPTVPFASSNVPTPGRSPMTPGDMTPGQPTPMGY